ncbi:hypothetical protein Tco_0715556 [Tanacetum coccineum]
MLDRSDFESWQQRIRLYCLGKENGENILHSIDEGPFKMGKFREILTDGALGLEQDKMLLEGSKLTIDERKSQLYDDFEHSRQNKGETIHEYYVRFTKLVNDMRNIKMIMPKMQLNSKFVNNMLLEWGRFVTVIKLNRGLKTSNYDQLYAYLKQHEAHANENKMMLERYTQHAIDPLAFVSNVSLQEYPIQSLAIPQFGYPETRVQNRVAMPIQVKQSHKVYITAWNREHSNNAHTPKASIKFRILQGQDAADASSGECSDLALNVDQVFQADQCDAFNSDVDEAPTAHTMFMANLSSADPIYDEAGPSYDSDILSEVQDYDNYLDSVDAEYTSDSNIIPYVKDNAVQVVQSNVSSMPNDALMMIINDTHEQAA